MVILFCARFYGQSFDIPLNQLEKSEIYLCCQKVAPYLTSPFRLLHEFGIIETMTMLPKQLEEHFLISLVQ